MMEATLTRLEPGHLNEAAANELWVIKRRSVGFGSETRSGSAPGGGAGGF